MKQAFIIVINILILFSCQSKGKKELEKSEKNVIMKKRTETKIYGDSLKVIYQYLGDTIIQDRIDLKGTSDDDFDSSFRVVSVWSTKKASKLECSDKLILTLDEIDFRYCYNEIFEKIERDIKKAKDKNKLWEVDGLKETKNLLQKYKSNNKIDISGIKEYYLFELLREIKFSAYDNKSKSGIQKIRVEKYETSFSGGNNYYLINIENDTIARFSRNEWMK